MAVSIRAWPASSSLAGMVGTTARPAIAPFVGADVVAVVHLDLTRLDVPSLARRLWADWRCRRGRRDHEGCRRWAGAASGRANDLYVLVSPRDLPDPPIVVVPLVEGADAQAIGGRLLGGMPSPRAKPTCATIHEAVVAGTAPALERVRRTPSPRDRSCPRLAAGGDSPVRFLVPLPDPRRVVGETLPSLPQELGGGPITPRPAACSGPRSRLTPSRSRCSAS